MEKFKKEKLVGYTCRSTPAGGLQLTSLSCLRWNKLLCSKMYHFKPRLLATRDSVLTFYVIVWNSCFLYDMWSRTVLHGFMMVFRFIGRGQGSQIPVHCAAGELTHFLQHFLMQNYGKVSSVRNISQRLSQQS